MHITSANDTSATTPENPWNTRGNTNATPIHFLQWDLHTESCYIELGEVGFLQHKRSCIQPLDATQLKYQNSTQNSTPILAILIVYQGILATL